jgi:hypothetical protein
MKRSLKFIIVGCLTAFSSAVTAQSGTNQDSEFADVIDQIRPTIAIVEARFTDGTVSTGTGFFVNQDAYVVTANHVLEAQGKQIQAIKVLTQIPTVAIGRGGIMAGNLAGSDASLVSADAVHDIAIVLPVRNPFQHPGAMINGAVVGLPKFAEFEVRTLRDGEAIFTSGYPLASRFLKTTSGKIASVEFSSDGSGRPFKVIYGRYPSEPRKQRWTYVLRWQPFSSRAL